MSNEIVEEVVQKGGGGAALAAKLGIKSRQAVYQWTRVPAAHVLKCEEITGVPRHRMRPDLYPAPQGEGVG